jgi:transcriptional regulator
MYIPPSFQEDRPEKLCEFIKSYSFGTLFSGAGEGLQASHLPFLLDEKAGPQGTLTGHMAKANSHWQSLSGQEVLVVFQGPHVYISPAWYEEPETVPTWNYVAVHVYGKYVPVTEIGGLRQILEKTVGVYETPMPKPWDMKGLPETYLGKMMKGIVGFEIPITRMEGKWKLSQNHPEERRQKVIRALERQGKPNALEIARLMAQKDNP